MLNVYVILLACFVSLGEGQQAYQEVAMQSVKEGSAEVELKFLSEGTYTIQQKYDMKYLDAYEDEGNGYQAVMRPRQCDDSQRWMVKSAGNGMFMFKIQQKINMRYLDALGEQYDYDVDTQDHSWNSSQIWKITPMSDGSFLVQHAITKRYLDAYLDNHDHHDYRVVTRNSHASLPTRNSQKWIFTISSASLRSGTYYIQQKVNMRYLEASKKQATPDLYWANVVFTRDKKGGTSQKWRVSSAGKCKCQCKFYIQQVSSGNSLDTGSYLGDGRDVFTSSKPFLGRWHVAPNSQMWTITPAGDGSFKVQNAVTNYYLDAYESGQYELNGVIYPPTAVVRSAQGDNSQKWIFTKNGATTTQMATGITTTRMATTTQACSIVTGLLIALAFVKGMRRIATQTDASEPLLASA